MNILAYIAQLIGGVFVMILGAITASVAPVIGENSPWKGLLCVLIALPICALGIFFAVIAIKSIFGW